MKRLLCLYERWTCCTKCEVLHGTYHKLLWSYPHYRSSMQQVSKTLQSTNLDRSHRIKSEKLSMRSLRSICQPVLRNANSEQCSRSTEQSSVDKMSSCKRNSALLDHLKPCSYCLGSPIALTQRDFWAKWTFFARDTYQTWLYSIPARLAQVRLLPLGWIMLSHMA